MPGTFKFCERQIAQFLQAHRNASFITVDTTTGLPYSATYSKGHPTPLGQIRTQDATFFFHSFPFDSDYSEDSLDTPPSHSLYSI